MYNINYFLELLIKKGTNAKLLDAFVLFHQRPLAANPESVDNTKFYAGYFPVHFKLLKANLRATAKRKMIDFFWFSFVGSSPQLCHYQF